MDSVTDIATEPKPSTGSALISLLFLARGLRGFGDGFAIIILPAYLTAIGYDPIQIGVVATASLLGTALLTLSVGAVASRYDLRSLLLLGAGLMTLSGLAFPNVEHIAWVVLVAFIGTVNPSTGDLGVLVPIEHAMLAQGASDQDRTKVFARYSLAGALSMAAGEYVSVSSQTDIERADLAREAREQREHPEFERAELAAIYQRRGLDSALADQVADALMAHDALGAHAREELGISRTVRARPVTAALTSAATFSVGAALPLIAAWPTSVARIPVAVSITSLVFLAALGSIAAYAGGARLGPAAVRVTFWGALAMALTAVIGGLVGAVL
jgi:VIT1/CCC1 family predicted Fe2+/Mn2+ transporter